MRTHTSCEFSNRFSENFLSNENNRSAVNDKEEKLKKENVW